MERVTAFVFDMDGVLIDSERPLLATLDGMLRAAGSDHDSETVRSVCGQPAAALRAYVAEHLGDGNQVDELLAAFGDEKLRLGAAGAIQAFPAAPSVLAMLRSRGLHLAVATSTHAAEAHDRLARNDLSTYLDAVVTGNEVLRGKPAPEIYLLAAERLGISPAECIVVEDSRAGVRAGLAAGMTVFALATTFPARELEAAQRVFDGLEELHSFIEVYGVGP